MIFITTKTWQDNDVEVIPVDKIKWLNEKNIEKKLRHSNLTMTTAKYSGDDRRKKKTRITRFWQISAYQNSCKRRSWNSSNNGLQNSTSSKI